MTTPSATPIRLGYDLTEADVHHYGTCGRHGKVSRSCQVRPAALLAMVGLGAFLVGICFHGHGIRVGSLALGTTVVVLVALAWCREARSERRVERLGRLMGLPRTLELVFSPRGIAEESESGVPDPGRIFTWDEVLEIARLDHLTIIRLRPAGGVLIVPDRAFDSPRCRSDFVETLKAWRGATLDPVAS